LEPDRKRPQEGRFPVSARIRGPLPERLTHCPPRRFTNSVSGRGSPRFEVTSFLFGGCLCEVSEPYGPSGIPSGLRGSDADQPAHDTIATSVLERHHRGRGAGKIDASKDEPACPLSSLSTYAPHSERSVME